MNNKKGNKMKIENINDLIDTRKKKVIFDNWIDEYGTTYETERTPGGFERVFEVYKVGSKALFLALDEDNKTAIYNGHYE